MLGLCSKQLTQNLRHTELSRGSAVLEAPESHRGGTREVSMHPNTLEELLKQLVGCLGPGFGSVSLDRDLKVYIPNKFPGDRQMAVLGTPSPSKTTTLNPFNTV